MIEIDPKTRILIVSSSELSNHALLLLKKAGLQAAVIQRDGVKALEQCAKESYALIFCDLETENLPGWHFVKECKLSEKIQNTPIIMFGETERSPIPQEKLKEYGIASFLPDKFELKPLMESVSAALAAAREAGSQENQYSLAKAALIAKRWEEAEKLYKNLRASTQNSSRSTIGLAQSLTGKKDFVQAENLLRDLASKDPDDPQSLLWGIKADLQANRHKEAKEKTERLLEKTKDTPLYHLHALDVVTKKASTELMTLICKKARARSFEYVEFYVAQAKVDYSAGKVDAAMKGVSRAKEKFGDSAEVANLEGICQRKNKKYKIAIACYERALKFTPMNAQIYFNMGLCFLAMEDSASARKNFQSSLKIDPKFDKAKEKLAELDAAARGTAA